MMNTKRIDSRKKLLCTTRCALNVPRLVFLAVLLVVATAASFADERGQAIARRIDQLEATTSSRMRFEMSIHPADGGERRVFVIDSYERANGDSLASFAEPRTIRGLRILSSGNNSWVFFPSTGRIRKIAGSSRSGSVQGVGGDFSYEDLGAGTWANDFDFDLTGETDETWVLSGKAKNADTVYDAILMTVSKKLERPMRIAFSSVKEGGFWKELTFSDYRDYSGRLRASVMEMRNTKTGSRTMVRLLEAAFDIRLEDRLFDPTRFDK
ncbi:MAG: outer membrane lipoprotein-sorting protein [Spirochaetales bacterium]|nr:MAG: outer membrane lipoprotein-sorting protein [Spirochaetales bacterium]